jgi:prevent-host-death family protein
MIITSTQLKRKISLIDNASREDILVTKRGKPFVVVMDDKRYGELIANQISNEEIDREKEPRVGWDEKFKD